MSTGVTSTNFPLTPEGKTMHLGVGAGDVNPRILSVGDSGRAKLISSLLDDNFTVFTSARNFTIYSGSYKSVPVSIIVTGMGYPMMDFVVREASFGIAGKIAMIRLGTCGILKENIKPSSVIIAKSSRLLQQTYKESNQNLIENYILSDRVHSSERLFELLKEKLCETLGNDKVADGLDLTCDTFYSSQGRIDERFDDGNEKLIEKIVEIEPEATAMEMETFRLLFLGQISRGKISASACMIGLLNRVTQELMDFSQLKHIELEAGRAVLNALIEFDLD